MARMSFRTKVGQGGRIVLPARLRQAAGFAVGDEIIVRLEDGSVRLLTQEESVKRAQAIIRRFIPPGRLLSEELIAERRAEAERE